MKPIQQGLVFKTFFRLLFLTIIPYTGYAQDEVSYEETVALEIKGSETQNSEETLTKPYIIMVSIDGFRYDYAEKHGAENMLEIEKNGSSLTRLIPSFPSKTFPNHYSIITGLYPAHHGIVFNSFYDKERTAEYKLSNRDAVENGTWYGGTPLWNLAQQQGMCTASYFWAGSEANVNNMFPTYYYEFDQQRKYEYRVKRVLEWLQLPEEKRPHFITLYFSLVDTQGHNYGPDAAQTKQAVQIIDRQIGDLRKGIQELGLPVYLIVTSDHGMDDLREEIDLHEFINIGENKFYDGPVAMIYTKDAEEKERLYKILSQHTEFRTYKQENVPNYLNFKNEQKIGDLVMITDAPKTIVYRKTKRTKPIKPGGMHGYDPFSNENMGAIFYMEGPDVKKNHKQPEAENVHIYPFVAYLLGLKITEPIDGNPEALKNMLMDE